MPRFRRMGFWVLAAPIMTTLITPARAQDCNNDGIPDADQMVGDYSTHVTNDFLPCTLDERPYQTLVNVPAAQSAVTLSVYAHCQNINDAGESIDLYANGMFLATLFEGTHGFEATEVVMVPADDWNTIRLIRPGNEVVFEGVRNTASCAGPDDTPIPGFCFEFTSVDVSYTFDADLNDNGWLDECIPDCNPNDTDSDGDGVPDNCDQCPGTIADDTIVDGLGCPIHLSQIDTDGDGDVDADDVATFGSELNGPGAPTAAGSQLDTDGDNDLDMADVTVLQRGARGRDVAADPTFRLERLPLYRLIRNDAIINWTFGDAYCAGVFGTHMGAVDKTSNISQQEQIDEMTAAAAADPDRSTWIGLRYIRPTALWTWSNGQQLIPPDQGGTDADNWDGITPDPTTEGGIANFAAAGHFTIPPYRWINAADQPSILFNVRNFLAQLPPSPVAPLSVATTETVTISLTSSLAGEMIAPGTSIDWTVSVEASGGDNAGLAAVLTDLVQDAGNPALFDIPQADSVPAAMSNFSAPDGISNPAENGAATGYVGVQRGTAGAMNLVQVGGAQNNLGEALHGGTLGQSANLVGGIGQNGAVVVASGTFVAPATEGEYTFRLENTVANVIHTLNSAPAASVVIEPSIDASAAGFSLTVVILDTDGDGVPDDQDQCPGSNDNLDTDGDGVPDGCDVCPGFDDNVDTDGNGTPDGCDTVAVPGDLDHDGNIDMDDYNLFLSAYGSGAGDANYNADADYDSDDFIGMTDFGIWYNHYLAFANS